MTADKSAVPLLTADEAIASAHDLAQLFAKDAARRDQERTLPYEEVRQLASSGLLAITVPDEFGGPELTVATVAEVIRLVAQADPNIAQIPLSHFVYVNHLRAGGTRQQQERFFADVLGGKQFGNAQSERGTQHVRDFRTTLTPVDGGWLLNGTKFYCTGAEFADWIPVLAHRGEGGPIVVAWVERHAQGVTVLRDWDAIGQRTTSSGTVKLEQVRVNTDDITNYEIAFEGPSTYGSSAQLLHAAIDTGIARAAVRDAAQFVTEKSRPYPDSIALYGSERANEDPLNIQTLGEMELDVRATEALLAQAAIAVDEANARLTDQSAAVASLAVAAARASSSATSVKVASQLFEVAGTRSALSTEGLDRHWRNARVHSLHDPAAWKIHHLGRWAATGTFPPRHGQI